MTRTHSPNDRGQAFPIYIVVVVGLLFAAFVFFAVGQASVTRSNAQGAADAGALAAAREAKDNLQPGLDLASLTSAQWKDLLSGGLFDPVGPCVAAETFAAKNGAKAACTAAGLRYSVSVETTRTVGDSVVPGTGDMHGKARATAEIKPLCHLGSGPPTPSGMPSPSPTPEPGGERPKPELVKIKCDTGDIEFDPLKPDPWRTLAKSLFRVRLVG
ncbi:pilus assembly protein TadG-related protein [Streptomyces sp. NPDC058655]|uniref:pilus assembly protein TadG-related protein n=1 Tax=Streptomyces sp. NPDC058655 TaxID=3346577 RepID=UPI0036659A9B